MKLKIKRLREDAILPRSAIAVATAEDKLISNELGVPVVDAGEYSSSRTYSKGESVYISKDGINYYFVAKTNGITNISPTNSTYWMADVCSKCIKGCKIRWGSSNPTGSVDVEGSQLVKGKLPYGGFYGTERLRGRGY